MADITKCPGNDCPVKNKCYRYTAPASARQSYFWNIPGKTEDNKFTCSMYWGDNAESTFNQLKEIFNNQ
jgi:hypothetical protein